MKKGKRIISIVLAATMALSLCACGKKGDKGGSGSTTAIVDVKNTTFAPSDFNITGYKGEIGRYFVSGDVIYFNSTEYNSGEPVNIDATETDAMATSVNHLYKVPITGGEATELKVPELDENSYYGNMFIGKDGNLCTIVESWNEESEDAEHEGFMIDKDGNVKDFDVSAFYEDQSEDSWVQSITGDDKGNVYVCYSNAVKVFDETGKKTSEVKLASDPNQYSDINGLTITQDGTVLVGVQNGEGVSVQKLDTAAGKLTDSYSLDIQYFRNGDPLMKGTDGYDFFYSTGTGVSGYKLADKSSTVLLDFTASDIDNTSITDQYMVDAQTFICGIWGNGDKGSLEMCMYKKVDPSQVKERKVLTCMSMYGNGDLKQSIINFNKTNTEYRIQFIDYSEKEDPQAAMSADIAAGNIPDIYDVSNGVGNLSVKQCVAKGMFEDLTPYFEKDPDLKKDDLIPGLYDALCVDGKLYFTAGSTYIVSMAAKKSDVGDRTGWTFAEMKEYVDSKPDAQMFYWSNSKSQLLNNFLYLNVDSYVDWSAGTCKFDSPEFKTLLEVCNKGTAEEPEYNEDMPSLTKQIREGKVLFSDCNISPDYLVMNDAAFDKDVTYIGYPAEDKKGNLYAFTNCLAMSAACKDKDIAWDFIKQIMTKEVQGKAYVQYGNAFYAPCPTRKDVFEMWLEACSATKAYTDEFGNEIEPINGGGGYADGEVIEQKPLSKEQVQIIRDAVANTSKGLWYDDSLLSIIKEEAEGYFKGDKSVDEVCSVIQNRVTTYVNENK